MRVLLASTLLLGACATADLRAAHSLDRGEWAAGVAAESQVTVASGELYPAEQLEPVALGLRAALPWELEDSSVEARLGLGKGWTLGLRGLPVRPLLGVTWSFVDERRQDVPLSLALALEGGYEPHSYAVFGVGLLGSRTALLTDGLAIVPAAALWLGPSYRRVELDLPQAWATDPEGATPVLWWELGGSSLSLPVGLELPVRIGEDLALAPTASWTTTVMLGSELDMGCRNCSVGFSALERQYSAELWLGLRLRPWLDPARRAR